MRDPEIDRQYADCTELVEAWKNYRDLFQKATAQDQPPLTREVEQTFMNVKARIAMLHDNFMAAVKHDKKIAQDMLDIVNRSITLRHLRKLSAPDRSKMEMDWHQTYLLLNETVQQLQEERERLEQINEFQYNMKRTARRFGNFLLRIVSSLWFKLLVAIGILVLIIILLPKSLWNKAREAKGIGEPYGAYLDFKRDTLGLGGPYSSMSKFTAKYYENASSSFQINARPEVQSTVPAQLLQSSGFSEVGGRPLTEFLSASTGFDARSIRYNSGDVQAFAYYWFEEGPAALFASSLQTAKSGQGSTGPLADYSAFYDNNVLVILRSGPGATPESRSSVQSLLFDSVGIGGR